MQQKRPNYESYLLRLWRVGGKNDALWHAMLVDMRTDERRSFARLELLMDFLVDGFSLAG